jgi:cation transport regulator ChaC
MSKPTKEYYQAKADLCKNLAIRQMTEGESGEAAKNLFRMVNALNEINLINYKEERENNAQV